jgi:hypothetical protein
MYPKDIGSKIFRMRRVYELVIESSENQETESAQRITDSGEGGK